MANTVEVVSTGQVLVTQVTEQAIEVQAPGAPLVVEVATAGPQGPQGQQGPAALLEQLGDVEVTAREQGSVLYYDAVSGKWQGNNINTVVTLTDGGGF